MKIAVFGATGGIGRHVVRAATAAGHEVRALVRDPNRMPADPPVEPVAGSLADADAVRRTVEGCDAVIWAVGATSNTADQVPTFEQGARHLVAAMREVGVRRLVALSGAGITVEGERKPIGGRVVSAIVRVVARHVHEAKRREYEVFRASGLDWTLVRPPRVTDGDPTGRVESGDRLRGRAITQGDLGAWMVRAAVDNDVIGRAPFVWGG